MADLPVLIPTRQFKTSAGEVELRPFKFKDFNKALSLIERYVGVFMVSQTAQEIAEKLFAKVQEGSYEILGDIEALLSLVGSGTAIESLQYDEVVALVVEVIDMNLDFFKSIGERLNKADKTEGSPVE